MREKAALSVHSRPQFYSMYTSSLCTRECTAKDWFTKCPFLSWSPLLLIEMRMGGECHRACFNSTPHPAKADVSGIRRPAPPCSCISLEWRWSCRRSTALRWHGAWWGRNMALARSLGSSGAPQSKRERNYTGFRVLLPYFPYPPSWVWTVC